MTTFAGPLYESTFLVAREHEAELDAWLEETSRQARQEAGIDEVHALRAEAAEPDRVGRLLQYRVADDSVMDELLDGFLHRCHAQLFAVVAHASPS